MRKKKIAVLCLCVCLVFSGGCGKHKSREFIKTSMYYLNSDGTGIVQEPYEIKGENKKQQIENMLKKMQEKTDSIDYKSVFPKGVRIKKWEVHDQGLTVYFNRSYSELDISSEVLLRAAVVKAFTQIKEIEYIEFYIEDKPLADRSGKEIGYMRGEDFIQNTGTSLHSYQLGNLNLYFANEKGDALVKEEVSVRYNSNTSAAKLIVEQLMKGPKGKNGHPTIPAGTKLLGVSVKDGICYVNFDEGFQNAEYRIDPKVTIYSVVNSIVAGGEAEKVQILINGETNVRYQGNVNLSKPLSGNTELVEVEKK